MILHIEKPKCLYPRVIEAECGECILLCLNQREGWDRCYVYSSVKAILTHKSCLNSVNLKEKCLAPNVFSYCLKS